MEIFCVFSLSLDTMDQQRKRKFSPVWDHFDLITENKVKYFSVPVSTVDHFSFGLFQLLSEGYLN